MLFDRFSVSYILCSCWLQSGDAVCRFCFLCSCAAFGLWVRLCSHLALMPESLFRNEWIKGCAVYEVCGVWLTLQEYQTELVKHICHHDVVPTVEILRACILIFYHLRTALFGGWPGATLVNASAFAMLHCSQDLQGATMVLVSAQPHSARQQGLNSQLRPEEIIHSWSTLPENIAQHVLASPAISVAPHKRSTSQNMKASLFSS